MYSGGIPVQLVSAGPYKATPEPQPYLFAYYTIVSSSRTSPSRQLFLLDVIYWLVPCVSSGSFTQLCNSIVVCPTSFNRSVIDFLFNILLWFICMSFWPSWVLIWGKYLFGELWNRDCASSTFLEGAKFLFKVREGSVSIPSNSKWDLWSLCIFANTWDCLSWQIYQCHGWQTLSCYSLICIVLLTHDWTSIHTFISSSLKSLFICLSLLKTINLNSWCHFLWKKNCFGFHAGVFNIYDIDSCQWYEVQFNTWCFLVDAREKQNPQASRGSSLSVLLYIPTVVQAIAHVPHIFILQIGGLLVPGIDFCSPEQVSMHTEANEAQRGYSYIALQFLYWGEFFHINPALTNTTHLIASLLEESIISDFSELKLKAGHNP